MSQFNLIANQVASSSTGVITTVTTASDTYENEPNQMLIQGNMKKGDVIFFFGALSHQLGNISTYLVPTFTLAWTKLANVGANDTYDANLSVYYHVLQTDSSAIPLCIDDDNYGYYANYYNLNPASLAFVVRGVDPSSISAKAAATANTRNVYFSSINISDSDYVLCVGTTGSNSLQPTDSFSISGGYIDIVSQLNDRYTGIDTRATAILRKPGTSGAYTETTWTHPSSGSADSSCGCVIKLSPL
jgi:hypothetical protein